MKKIVYISSPLRGKVEANIKRTRDYCLFATTQEAIPFAPHIYFTQFLNDNNPAQRKLGMDMGLEFLKMFCDELWAFGPRTSQGMGVEIKAAEKIGVPVYYYTEQCGRI